MMKVSSRGGLALLLLVLACLLALTSGVPDPKQQPAKVAVSCGAKKLGENFTDWTVPTREAATVGESLGFAALVVGVLAIASVNTYFKVKNSPGGLPGYSQAIYMREQL